MTSQDRGYTLRELGLFGYDAIEDVIIASLVTGDPLLLVGTHGTAKTMLCKSLSKALGLEFIAYDASKALFEDVLGFPNPYSMEKGVVDYISTPISIQGKEFVLVDELSRANYQLQGKWLEIIRSRRIMGQEIRSLKHIFGAMNPPSYLGARPLDPALSGRFAFIVWAPAFPDLNEEAKRAVIANLGEDDALAIRSLQKDVPSNPSLLPKVVEESRSLYPDIESRYNGMIGDFILSLEKLLTSNNYQFDGRRASMVRRSILAILSVKASRGINLESNLPTLLQEAVPCLLPYSVELEDYRQDSLTVILEDALQEIFGLPSERDTGVWDNLCITNLIGMVEKETDVDRKLSLIRRLYRLPITEDNVERIFEFHNEYFRDVGCNQFLNIFTESGIMPDESGVKVLTEPQVCSIRLAQKFYGTASFLKSRSSFKEEVAYLRDSLEKGGKSGNAV